MGSYQSVQINGKTTVVETVGNKLYINGVESKTGKPHPKYCVIYMLSCAVCFVLGFLGGLI